MVEHRNARSSGLLTTVAVIVLVGAMVLLLRTDGNSLPGNPVSTCVPTPAPPTPIGTPSSTPDSSMAYTPVPTHDFGPTLTPYPIAEVIDLSGDSAVEDRAQVAVFRCDGKLVLYIIAKGEGNSIPLGPGDTIYNSAPAESQMGIQLHVSTPTLEPIVTMEPPFDPSQSTPVPAVTPTTGAYPAETFISTPRSDQIPTSARPYP